MATKLLTDGELQREVLKELEFDPEVEPADVGVEVDKGVVTLTGTVESYSMKLAAENAAKRVKGVKAVANDIEVKLAGERTRTDTNIARAAASALEWNTDVPHERIKVTVREGQVILEGDVDKHFRKEAAESSVRYLVGVNGVTNLIRVTAPKVSAEEVKSLIEEALERSAKLNAEQIKVEVHDEKVILKGSVHSLVEKEDAEGAAWEADGVSDVENRITISP